MHGYTHRLVYGFYIYLPIVPCCIQITDVQMRAEGGLKPGQVLCSVATEEKAVMIVMGTRGMGKVRRTILGSVSDFVIHHACCPVVVCRHARDAPDKNE